MNTEENKLRVTVTIDPEVVRRLDDVAEKRGESRSGIVERMVRRCLDDDERYVRAMEDPVQRAIMQAMAEAPGLVAAMAKMLGEEIDIDAIRQRLPADIERGKRRQESKSRGADGLLSASAMGPT